jgi:hypothetical protein
VSYFCFSSGNFCLSSINVHTYKTCKGMSLEIVVSCYHHKVKGLTKSVSNRPKVYWY